MGQLIVLMGDDEASIAENAKVYWQQLAGEDPDPFSAEVFKETTELSSEQIFPRFLESFQTPPFMGGGKQIWLQGFSGFSDEVAKSAKKVEGLALQIREFASMLREDFPDDIHVMISSSTLDKRKPLYKTCKELGKVLEFKKPEMNNFRWREEVANSLKRISQELGMQLSPNIIQYLTEVIGTDTGRIYCELEKIYCFAGNQPSLNDVREVCVGNREAHFFAFTNALGNRDLKEAISALNQTLTHAKNADSECIRLVRQTATQFRKILHSKVLMMYTKCNAALLYDRIQQFSDADREKFAGNLCLAMSAWQMKNTAQQAEKFGGQELQNIVKKISRIDLLHVSSSIPNRVLLETLVMEIVHGNKVA